MGRLKKSQTKHRNAGKQGGRGRKKLRIPESPIKTPIKPKTTAWRHKQRAAKAEKELHAAALASIILPIGSSRPSTSHMSMGSRPSTAGQMSFTMTRPSTGYKSIAATAGSYPSSPTHVEDIKRVVDIPIRDIDTLEEIEETQSEGFELANTDDESIFEDIEELEMVNSAVGPQPNAELTDAIEHWPRVSSLILKKLILELGMI